MFLLVQLNGLDFSSSLGLLEGPRDEAIVGLGPLLHLDCFKWVERDSYLPQVKDAAAVAAAVAAYLFFSPCKRKPR